MKSVILVINQSARKDLEKFLSSWHCWNSIGGEIVTKTELEARDDIKIVEISGKQYGMWPKGTDIAVIAREGTCGSNSQLGIRLPEWKEGWEAGYQRAQVQPEIFAAYQKMVNRTDDLLEYAYQSYEIEALRDRLREFLFDLTEEIQDAVTPPKKVYPKKGAKA